MAKTKHDELGDMIERIEQLAQPMLESSSLGTQIDGLVILSAIENAVAKRVKLLKEAIEPQLPEVGNGQKLVCNGSREHIEVTSVATAAIDPHRLAAELSLEDLCDCVRVLLGKAEERLGEEKAKALKEITWSRRIFTRRGRHPKPNVDARKLSAA